MRRILLVFLGNPTAGWMLFAFLACLGLVALLGLPVSLMPPSAREGYTVLTRWPGVDGERIERAITRPIEGAVTGTAGLRELVSMSEAGSSRLHLRFERGFDARRLGAELRNKVEAVSAAFPRDCEKPVFLPLEAGEQSAMILTVAGVRARLDPKKLREAVDLALKPALARLPGVGEVQVSGGEAREITIALDRGALSARGVSPDRVIQALQEEQVSRPLGAVDRGARSWPVVLDGRFKDLGALRRAPILALPGKLVRLEDLARVEDGAKDPETLSTLDGREKITVYLQASASARLLELSGKVRRELECFRISASLGAPLETEVLFDASRGIRGALWALARTLLEAAAAASLFLFLFTRRGQPWALALLTLPASILPVFFFFQLSQVGLNVVSLSGLGLCAGMALDANIVVLSMLSRIEPGRRAVVRALEKAAGPLAVSIACALIIFLPLLAMRENASAVFRDLALAIVFSLALSLLFAFLLTPTLWLARRRAAPGGAPSPAEPVPIWLRPPPPRDGRRLARLRERIDRFEAAAVDWILSLPKRRFMVAGAAVLLILLALALFPFLSRESAPIGTGGELLAYLELPPGTTLQRCRTLSGEAEALLRSSGGPRLGTIQARVETGRVSYVIAFSNASARERRRIASDLRRKVRTLGEGFVHFEESRAAGDGDASLTLDVLADDAEGVRALAARLGSEISRLPEAEEVLLHFREGRPSWILRPDRSAMALWDLTPEDAGRLLRDCLYGPVAIKYLEAKREVDVRVRLEGREVGDLASLLSMPVLRTNGPPLPLLSFFQSERSSEASKIWRKNKKYLASLSVRPKGASGADLGPRIEAVWKGLPREAGTRLEWGGETRSRALAREELATGVLLSALLIFMLLASLFQSLRLPLQVLCVVPIALAGSVVALFALRIPLDLPVYLGWMILCGLSVNGALLLLDAIRSARARGLSGEAAVRQGLGLRLRSAAMTTGATLAGLLPMFFFSQAGGEWIRSLAITVFWGMAWGFAATITLIPLFHLEGPPQIAAAPGEKASRLDRVWETFARWMRR